MGVKLKYRDIWNDSSIEFLFSTISIMLFNYGLPESSILIQGWNDLKVPFLRDIDRERKEWGERVLEGDGRISWRHVRVIDNTLGTDSNSLTTQGIHLELLCKSSRKSFLDSFPRDACNHFLPFSEIAGGVNRPNFTLSSGMHYAHENGVKPGLFHTRFLE